jgi:hypothetical protein
LPAAKGINRVTIKNILSVRFVPGYMALDQFKKFSQRSREADVSARRSSLIRPQG